jgi:anaerobic selenocysteine-containing dehydrogenase
VLVTVDDDRPRDQGAGRPLASRHARLPLRQSGEVSRPRLLARPPALSHAPQARRAKAPLRVKGREAEAFERISWDEALGPSPRACKPSPPSSARRASCPTATPAPSASSATAPWTAASSIASERRSSTAPSAPRPAAALKSVYGVKLGTPRGLRPRRLIIAWGANIHGNNIHLWPFIEEARRKGARSSSSTPTAPAPPRSPTSISPSPGTDTMLALAMMHVIFRDGLEDRDYIAACTHGFEELRAHALKPEHSREARRITGIDAETIERLARAYATDRQARRHPPELRHPAQRERRAPPPAPSACCR